MDRQEELRAHEDGVHGRTWAGLPAHRGVQYDLGIPEEIHGFAEAAGSGRVANDPTTTSELVMTEARFRLDIAHYATRGELVFKGDFLADNVTGAVDTDIRAALFKARMAAWLDVRAGRQVLTWGTGDLLFLNDLFPKDWVSFSIGRDDEFLKAPSNSLALAAYSKPINIDFVWTPQFAPNRYITGERLSFFDPMAGGIVSAETMGGPLDAIPPAKTVVNGTRETIGMAMIPSYPTPGVWARRARRRGHLLAARRGYQWSDAVNVTLGANVMTGDEDTFFGQFQNNSNLYLRLRYSF